MQLSQVIFFISIFEVAVSLSLSSCVPSVELTDGRDGGGRGRLLTERGGREAKSYILIYAEI